MVKLVTVLERHVCNGCKGSGKASDGQACRNCRGKGTVEVEVTR